MPDPLPDTVCISPPEPDSYATVHIGGGQAFVIDPRTGEHRELWISAWLKVELTGRRVIVKGRMSPPDRAHYRDYQTPQDSPDAPQAAQVAPEAPDAT